MTGAGGAGVDKIGDFVFIVSVFEGSVDGTAEVACM